MKLVVLLILFVCLSSKTVVVAKQETEAFSSASAGTSSGHNGNGKHITSSSASASASSSNNGVDKFPGRPRPMTPSSQIPGNICSDYVAGTKWLNLPGCIVGNSYSNTYEKCYCCYNRGYSCIRRL